MIRTRFAPSPTGPLHVGGARTALFNFLFARRYNGKFFLRIEDTDQERSDPRFQEDILNGLTWLGLNWDGQHLQQSLQTHRHRTALERLLAEGKAFWCAHSREELAVEREAQTTRHEPPRHICNFRDGAADSAPGEGIIRFRNDATGLITFADLIRGEVSFQAELLGDFSVAKRLDAPLYNLAVVVDDAELGVSHVIRGEDHISNTPKQLLLMDALGIARPQYAHLPLILGSDRSKLSKRHGAVSVNEYRQQGYLPEALVNFMALLGWHGEGDRECYTKEELIEHFDIADVQKSGAVFDTTKLDWMNREYLKAMPEDDFTKAVIPYMKSEWQKHVQKNPSFWSAVRALILPRMSVLGEIAESANFFFEEPYYAEELLLWKEEQTPENARGHLKALQELLETQPPDKFFAEDLRARIMPYAQQQEGGRGTVLWPFRVALTGKRASPDPFDIAAVLGRTEVIARINKAISVL